MGICTAVAQVMHSYMNLHIRRCLQFATAAVTKAASPSPKLHRAAQLTKLRKNLAQTSSNADRMLHQFSAIVNLHLLANQLQHAYGWVRAALPITTKTGTLQTIPETKCKFSLALTHQAAVVLYSYNNVNQERPTGL